MPPAPPRVEVFLPVGVDCLVKPGFCRLWSFLTRNPALHSPFTSVMSLVTLSLQNHCSCIPVPPLPSTGLLLHWSQNEKDSEASQTAEAKLLRSWPALGRLTVLSLGAHFPLSGWPARWQGARDAMLMVPEQGTRAGPISLLPLVSAIRPSWSSEAFSLTLLPAQPNLHLRQKQEEECA